MTAPQPQSVSFFSQRKFYDDEHFPYGIDRSGEFTVKQARVLTDYGHAFMALATGQRQPLTDEELAFVQFCQGQKSAESEFEKTWQRYTFLCQRDNHFFTLNSRKTSSSNSTMGEDYDSYDDSADDDD